MFYVLVTCYKHLCNRLIDFWSISLWQSTFNNKYNKQIRQHHAIKAPKKQSSDIIYSATFFRLINYKIFNQCTNNIKTISIIMKEQQSHWIEYILNNILSNFIDACTVRVNMFLRSISKIDDYKMVSVCIDKTKKNQQIIKNKNNQLTNK